MFPEDVKALLTPILAHRTLLSPEALLRGDSVASVLERTVGRIKPPMVGTSSNSVPMTTTSRRRQTRAAS